MLRRSGCRALRFGVSISVVMLGASGMLRLKCSSASVSLCPYSVRFLGCFVQMCSGTLEEQIKKCGEAGPGKVLSWQAVGWQVVAEKERATAPGLLIVVGKEKAAAMGLLTCCHQAPKLPLGRREGKSSQLCMRVGDKPNSNSS
eukprot:superscaffoldBa00002708_g15067